MNKFTIILKIDEVHRKGLFRHMTITEILGPKLDSRKNGTDCTFNGYLEDFMGQSSEELEPVLKEAFTAILSKYPDAKICVGLRSGISENAISNQIIRYKDIFKLKNRPLVYPYILYTAKDGVEKAMMVVPYSEFSFIYAKGLYYCMTEPGSEFIDNKNDIVAVTSDDPEVITETFDGLFEKRAGAIQRRLDSKYYRNYDELKEKAIRASEQQREGAVDVLTAVEDRGDIISEFVVNWFLLKKVLYVQYMVDKHLLNSVHEGNIKKQRNQAKLNADEVRFISYSDMWRARKEEAEEAPAPDTEETE